MLSFFPILYPDELLYSALARYHIRSGNKSFRQTDLELFGYSSQQLCKVTLTNNLNYLVKNLSLFSQITVSDLLQNHTLYPFYATFLMPQEAWQLKDSMKTKLHDLKNISIQTIPGIPNKDGCLNLNEHSRLRIRLPADQIQLVYRFAGKKLLIGNKHKIRLDIPQIYLLEPVKKLRSRIVVIRGYEEPDTFLVAAQRQLEKLGIQGIACITTNSNGKPKRKSIKVKNTLVGFGLEVKNLSDEDSMTLQIHGIGGKHKMGCGVFTPLKQQK